MHHAIARTFLAATLLSGLAAGCANIVDGPEAGVGLERATQRALLACQKTINRESAKFVAAAQKGLGRCVESAIALRMEEDALPGSQSGSLEPRRAALLRRCDADFGRVGAASVKLIAAILRSCDLVAEELLHQAAFGDPLRFRALHAVLDSTGRDELLFDDVGEIGGLVCGVGVQAVGSMLFVQSPRHADAIRTHLGVFPSDFEDHLRTFLDPRCVNVDE